MRRRAFRWGLRLLLVLVLGVIAAYSNDARAGPPSTWQGPWQSNFGACPQGKVFGYWIVGQTGGGGASPSGVMDREVSGFDAANSAASENPGQGCPVTVENDGWESYRIARSTSRGGPEPRQCGYLPSSQYTVSKYCRPPPVCGANEQLPMCDCIAGYERINGQCVMKPCPTAGTLDTIVRSGMPEHNCMQVANGAICETEISVGLIFNGTSSITAHEIVYTGQQCPDDDVDLTNPAQPFETPIGEFTPDNGQSAGRRGCGYLNGSYVCLGEPAGDGDCTRLSGGGGFCVTTPLTTDTDDEAPDNGTAGQPATPGATATFTDDSGATTATTGFYTGQQFQNSTNHGDGGDDEPDCEANPSAPGCDDGGGDGGDCEANPQGEGCGDCEGDDCGPGAKSGSVKGPGGTARTFGESIGTVSAAWANSPAKTKLNGLQIPSGGNCPSPTISMPYLNTSVTMNAHCQLAAGIRNELRAIFLALWVIVAVGVFLRP